MPYTTTQHNKDISVRLLFLTALLQFLDKLLRKLKDENHKVLIFSQMTRQLDILEDYVATRGFEYERLDGSHSQAQREHSLRQFRKGNTFVFLLSTRAGGTWTRYGHTNTHYRSHICRRTLPRVFPSDH